MNGAQGRNRTTDTMIFSHVLYQLSYLGTRGTRLVAGGPDGRPGRVPRVLRSAATEAYRP